MDRYIKRLNKEDSVLSVNKDFNIKTQLTNTNELLIPGENNRIINQYDQFVKERNESTKFRFITTIKPLISNPLFDVSESTEWGGFIDNHWGIFSESRFTDISFIGSSGDDLSYSASYRTYLTEKDGWFGFIQPFNIMNPVVTCGFEEMIPNRKCFDTVTRHSVKNWGVRLTYPHSEDNTHFLVKDGLYISNIEVVDIGGRDMNVFETPIKHGMLPGNKISISSTTGILIGEYDIKMLGYPDGAKSENAFIIDTSANPITSITNGRMKKVMGTFGSNRSESEYYFRIYSSFTEYDDYEIYPLGFEVTIDNDGVSQLIFNGGTGADEDVDIKGLKDNKGRPLSELYMTIVKNNNLGFSNVKSGVDMIYSDYNIDVEISDIHKIHDGVSTPIQTNIPLETNVSDSNSSFYGDVVEYNKFSLIEVVLAKVNHRFNTNNRHENGREEGYYYNPHNLIKIREYSAYIEQGETNTLNMPIYAVDLQDGRYLWRDLLTLGPSSLDYPFSNGMHYLVNDIQLSVRRQDPFIKYGLFYLGDNMNDPRDPIGDFLDGDDYEIKRNCGGC